MNKSYIKLASDVGTSPLPYGAAVHGSGTEGIYAPPLPKRA